MAFISRTVICLLAAAAAATADELPQFNNQPDTPRTERDKTRLPELQDPQDDDGINRFPDDLPPVENRVAPTELPEGSRAAIVDKYTSLFTAPGSEEKLKRAARPTVIHLRHARAEAVAKIIDQLYQRAEPAPRVVVDQRLNAVLIQASPQQTEEVRELAEVLDSPGPADKAIDGDSDPFGDTNLFPVPSADDVSANEDASTAKNPLGSDSGSQGTLGAKERLPDDSRSIAELQRKCDILEQRTRELAARLQDPARGKISSSALEELTESVRRSFLARQTLQRARLEQFRRRLDTLQQSIITRDRIARQIVARRVEELLNPELRWSGRGSESVVSQPASDTAESDPLANDKTNTLGGTHTESTRLPSQSDFDKSEGIIVEVPLNADLHPSKLIQRNLDNTRLTLLGSGVRGFIEGREYSNLVAVLAHRCKLISVTPVIRNEQKFLTAKIFVPQGPRADGSNLSLTQARIDTMTANDVEFRLEGLDHMGTDASPDTTTAETSTGQSANSDTTPDDPTGFIPLRPVIRGNDRGTVEWVDGDGTVIHTSEASTFEGRAGSVMRFRWSDLPQAPDQELFAKVILHSASEFSAQATTALKDHPIPIALPDTVIESAASGEIATWISYWPDDAEDATIAALQAVHATTLSQSVDALERASSKGTPVCTIYLSKANLPDLTILPAGTWPELEGEWKLVEFSSSDKSFPLNQVAEQFEPRSAPPMRITGNVMIRHSTDGSIRESRIEYDKDSEPHSLTIMRLRNGKQFRNRYIVSVKDGTLRLASSMNGSSQIPEAFDGPRTVVQTYRRHHSTQTTELATPEATLDQMTQYGNAKDYHGFVSLLTDQEAERMSGLMMMSATSLLTIQGLMTSAAGDADVPGDLPINHVASVMQKYIRKDAPPEALSAFRALTTKAAGLIVGQIPGASIDSQGSSLPADTPEELSQLLLAAADALSDQRAFCAEMLEALDQVSPSENKDQTPSWQITQTEDAAVAVDTRPEASEGDTSTMAGSIEVELQRVDGRWLITRLISNDQLQQMLNGPVDADSTPEADGQHYPATLQQSPPTEFLPAPNDNTNARDSLIPTFSDSTESSSTNAESITIRSTEQTSDEPKVSWGPTQNGLQMAVTTDSPNTPMASPLTVSCLLKNVSDHEIAIVDDGWSLSVETDIRRTSQAQLQTILGAVSGAFTPEKFVLGPGEQRVVASARIRVTDDTEVEAAPPQADVLIVDPKARQFHNAIYILRCRVNVTLDDDAETRVPLISEQTGIAFSSPENEPTTSN